MLLMAGFMLAYFLSSTYYQFMCLVTWGKLNEKYKEKYERNLLTLFFGTVLFALDISLGDTVKNLVKLQEKENKYADKSPRNYDTES